MNSLHWEVVSEPTKEIFQKISLNSQFSNFYLAGGTSLSLQIGHRKSIDLDFFTNTDFKSNIVSFIDVDYFANVLFDNSIEIVANQTKILFFYFGFPLYKELKTIDGFVFADPIDIGLMKLLALEGRVSKKGIVDLYFIDREIIPLENLLEIFNKFYPKEKFNEYKSLSIVLNKESYAKQPMPIMLKECKWDDCFDRVQRSVIDFAKKKILH